MSHVFISYAHEDTGYVDRLCQQLDQYGFAPRTDKDIPPGGRWWSNLEAFLEEAAAILVIMTPEAKNSEWVEKEILIAIELQKPIFPLLLRGEVFKLLITVQYTSLVEDHGFLPPISFYQMLAQVAPRTPIYTPEQMEEEAKKRADETEKRRQSENYATINRPYVEPDPAIYDEIQKWERYAKAGENDFYGIAMLALALEAEGSYRSHKYALEHLRRACKIEPFVKNKRFMADLYGWTETQHNLLEQILIDPKFLYSP